MQKSINPEPEILGYRFDQNKDQWEPIYPLKKGYIATQAFILCRECRSAISSVGGPSYNSVCLGCWDNQRLFDFLDGKDKEKTS